MQEHYKSQVKSLELVWNLNLQLLFWLFLKIFEVCSWNINQMHNWRRISSALRGRNLKTEFSLWKGINCFPSTLHSRKLSLNTQQSAFILNLFHFVWGKLGQGNHSIIAMSSFPKSSVFGDSLSLYTKTKSWCFSNYSGLRSFRKALPTVGH